MTVQVPDEDAAELAAMRMVLLQAELRLAALRQDLRRQQDAHAALLRQPPPEPPPPVIIDDPASLERIGRQDDEIALLRLHLDAYQSSAIWRATWPLRRLLDRHPGLARAGRRALTAAWWTVTLQGPARLKTRTQRRLQALQVPEPPEPPSLPAVVVPAEPPPVVRNEAPRLTLPTSRTPLVSVIVPTFGQVAVTLRCLRAIAAAETVTPFEVIVAEDASGDPEVALLERVAGLRLVRNPVNLGFLHNCNEAALLARGTFLLFLNNDTEPLPGFLDALVRLAEALPDAGLVGSKLLFPDGRLQEAGGIVWQDGTGWN